VTFGRHRHPGEEIIYYVLDGSLEYRVESKPPMTKTVPDAASYAPITILVDERADGVHLSYDSMASLIAPYGSQAALAVARELDAKIECLLETAAR
jgi:hypothetical protein